VIYLSQRKPLEQNVQLAGLRRVHCVVVSPKVDDCTSASEAVKPPANNCARIFFRRAVERKILREMPRTFCHSAQIFFLAIEKCAVEKMFEQLSLFEICDDLCRSHIPV
jgi:hypothetical protein